MPQSKRVSTTLPRLIGVIHLPALPGAPGSSRLHPAQALDVAGTLAVKEAQLLARAGFDGIILENFGDVPFMKDQVAPETVASMAVIVAAVRSAVNVKLGVNVLRNDGFSALAIAAVTGADFIRVNVLSGAAATDQGIIEGKAAPLMRERVRLGAPDVAVMADVLVKHARTLSETDLTLAIEEATFRAGAEGVIVTGSTTGRAPDRNQWSEALGACRRIGKPLFAGSGITVETLNEWAKNPKQIPHGVIVGSALRKGGKAGAPLDTKRLGDFVRTWKKKVQRRG
ncbi:MAG: BtpA/SgcQ family protein [Bdellovibrionales bacterium]|nr:BtpA/SgcQ family protein [Bdellovibrionales bacterium]